MKTKFRRLLSVIAAAIGMGSLSACFQGPYYRAYPGYRYGQAAPAYPEYYSHYYPQYVPAPRYYVYNNVPRNWNWDPEPREHWRWEHRERKEHKHRSDHHDHDDRF
jgi:hypothetical protein